MDNNHLIDDLLSGIFWPTAKARAFMARHNLMLEDYEGSPAILIVFTDQLPPDTDIMAALDYPPEDVMVFAFTEVEAARLIE